MKSGEQLACEGKQCKKTVCKDGQCRETVTDSSSGKEISSRSWASSTKKEDMELKKRSLPDPTPANPNNKNKSKK